MRNPFKRTSDIVKELFTFNRAQRKGMIFLLSILSLWCVFLIVINRLPPKPNSLNKQTIQSKILAYEQWKKSSRPIYAEQIIQEQRYNDYKKPFSTEEDLPAFSFNPNTANDETFRQLGFKDYHIQSIRKYLSKAGTYTSRQSFMSMYFMQNEKLKKLQAFVDLPDKSESTSSYSEKYSALNLSKDTLLPINLNIATAEQLMKVKSIGKARAAAIIKYRDDLGGYFSTSQLHEVKYMDSTSVAILMASSYIVSAPLRMISINTATIEQLKHPYINTALANFILNHRKFHGSFTSKEQLKKMALLNEELYSKIAPYIVIENENLNTHAE
ncbi:MAG TPA: helix-hairpin-helix domain-containing protein [Bacteroidia bacterium]|nr:helix-hairpin-helix domain-containing protein [Bacteroidia bacterium]HNT79978.1 helix-hairpin-helix domain-containing protein [Bacteroidia bacterium]